MKDILFKRPAYIDSDTDPQYVDEGGCVEIINMHTVKAEGGGGDLAVKSVSIPEQTHSILSQLTISPTLLPVGRVYHQEKDCFYAVFSRNSEQQVVFAIIDNKDNYVKPFLVTDRTVCPVSLKYVSCDFYVTQINTGTTIQEEVLFYCTDNNQEPVVIPVYYMLNALNNNPTLYNTLVSDFDKYFRIKRTPPEREPKVQLMSNPDVKTNNIAGWNWQFRYRYKLITGEWTEYSPVSDFVDTTKDKNIYNTDTGENNNYIRITYDSGYLFVSTVEIIARKDSLSEWFVIYKERTSPDNPNAFFDFYNTTASEAAPPQITNTLFFNIPTRANTLKISENLLFFGGYSQGFPDVSLSTRVIRKKPPVVKSTNIPVTVSTNSFGVRHKIEIDLSSFFYNYNLIHISFDVFVRQNNTETTKRFYLATTATDINDLYAKIVSKIIALNLNGLVTLSINATSIIIETLLSNISIQPFVSFSNIRVYRSSLNTNKLIFKSDSTYKIGIVYDDKLGRVSPVYPIAEVATFRYLEETEGYTDIYLRISHAPPQWAKSYRIVSTKNSNYEDFITLSTVKVYPMKRAPKSLTQQYKSENIVFVALRGFVGKKDSYTESYGAKIKYNFVQGDRLRIIKKVNSNTLVPETSYVDFEILGYEIYESNDDNPIYEGSNTQTQYQTTGHFLIVKADVPGYTPEDVVNVQNSWSDDINGAVFEIVRPKKNPIKEPYYEISPTYDCSQGFHDNPFQPQGGLMPNIPCIVSSVVFTSVVTIGEDEYMPFITGSSVTINDTHVRTVTNITRSEGFWLITLDSSVPVTGSAQIRFTNPRNFAEIKLTGLDCFYRQRILRQNNNPNTNIYIVQNVEDPHSSDFYTSSREYIKRAAYTEEVRQIRRYGASIIHTAPSLQNEQVIGFSEIKPTDQSFQDYDAQYGEVEHIDTFTDGDLCVFQHSKVLRQNLNKAYIYTATGGAITTKAERVLSNYGYYAGNYGISGHPESHDKIGNVHFFADKNQKTFCRLGQGGIEDLRLYKARKYVEDFYKNYGQYMGVIRILGVYDYLLNEYMACINVIGYEGIIYEFTIRQSNQSITLNLLLPTHIARVPTPNPANVMILTDEERDIVQVCEHVFFWGVYVIDVNQNNPIVPDTIEVYPQDATGTIYITLRLFTSLGVGRATLEFPSTALPIINPIQICTGKLDEINVHKNTISLPTPNVIVFNNDLSRFSGKRPACITPGLYLNAFNKIYIKEIANISKLYSRHSTGENVLEFYLSPKNKEKIQIAEAIRVNGENIGNNIILNNIVTTVFKENTSDAYNTRLLQIEDYLYSDTFRAGFYTLLSALPLGRLQHVSGTTYQLIDIRLSSLPVAVGMIINTGSNPTYTINSIDFTTNTITVNTTIPSAFLTQNWYAQNTSATDTKPRGRYFRIRIQHNPLFLNVYFKINSISLLTTTSRSHY